MCSITCCCNCPMSAHRCAGLSLCWCNSVCVAQHTPVWLDESLSHNFPLLWTILHGSWAPRWGQVATASPRRTCLHVPAAPWHAPNEPEPLMECTTPLDQEVMNLQWKLGLSKAVVSVKTVCMAHGTKQLR